MSWALGLPSSTVYETVNARVSALLVLLFPLRALVASNHLQLTLSHTSITLVETAPHNKKTCPSWLISELGNELLLPRVAGSVMTKANASKLQ